MEITLTIMDFFILVLANLLALVVFTLALETSKSNVGFFLRVSNWRFNCLAYLYEQIKILRQTEANDDLIQEKLRQQYGNRLFPFMTGVSPTDAKAMKNIAFIGKLINNKELLFDFADAPSFGRKEFRRLEKRLEENEILQSARGILYESLVDRTPESVEASMTWLHELLSEPFVPYPEDPERLVGKIENTYALFYLCRGKYFKESLTVDGYKSLILSLQEVFPDISVSFSRHSSDWAHVTEENYPRAKETLKRIESIVRGGSGRQVI